MKLVYRIYKLLEKKFVKKIVENGIYGGFVKI